MSPEKIADLRLKHLEMMQALVTRMAGYGASFKSYCITVVTAVLGYAFTLQRPGVAALALLPLIAFAGIDAQYLRIERRYRALFDRIRAEKWDEAPSFEMSLNGAPRASYFEAFASWSIMYFYGVLAVGVLAAILGARLVYG